MSSAGGGRRRLLLSVVVLLLISVLQIWVCSDCMVRAIRIFPANGWGKEKEFTQKDNNDVMNEKNKKKKSRNEDLFNKFFSRRRALDFNQTQNVFEESKRKVPSCPDPLHN